MGDRPQLDLIEELEPIGDSELEQKLEQSRAETLARFRQLYGEPDVGRHRAVFHDPERNLVYKVPLNWAGVDANYHEQSWDRDDIPLASCRIQPETEEAWPVLEMERVTPSLAPYDELPFWAGVVDCAQVGHTADGRLVAYDL